MPTRDEMARALMANRQVQSPAPRQFTPPVASPQQPAPVQSQNLDAQNAAMAAAQPPQPLVPMINNPATLPQFNIGSAGVSAPIPMSVPPSPVQPASQTIATPPTPAPAAPPAPPPQPVGQSPVGGPPPMMGGGNPASYIQSQLNGAQPRPGSLAAALLGQSAPYQVNSPQQQAAQAALFNPQGPQPAPGPLAGAAANAGMPPMSQSGNSFNSYTPPGATGTMIAPGKGAPQNLPPGVPPPPQNGSWTPPKFPTIGLDANGQPDLNKFAQMQADNLQAWKNSPMGAAGIAPGKGAPQNLPG